MANTAKPGHLSTMQQVVQENIWPPCSIQPPFSHSSLGCKPGCRRHRAAEGQHVALQKSIPEGL